MITIFQFPPAFGLPVSVSPYCAKLEAYLRLTGRKYATAVGDVRKSPNKAVPYVTGLGDGLVADSHDIISELERQGPTLDEGLSTEDAELGFRLERRAESDLYFACLHARFVEDAGWAHQKATVKALVPWVLSPILVPVIRSSQVKKCRENDFPDAGSYPRAESAADEIAEQLGDKPFLFGDDPRIADCSVWANLLQNAYTPSANPARDAVRGSSKLVDYIERFAKRAELKLPPLA